MKRYALLAMFCGATSTFAAHAKDDGYSAAYTACMDTTDGVTANMLNCMAAEHKQQDARLNQRYKSALKALSASQQNELKEAQRLWIKYRDANCSFLGGITGGSIDSINRASCFLDMTKARADDLQWVAEMGEHLTPN